MSSIRDTDRLIRKLAREAGTRRRPVFSSERTLLLVVALSLLVAVIMVFTLFGVSPELMATAILAIMTKLSIGGRIR